MAIPDQSMTDDAGEALDRQFVEVRAQIDKLLGSLARLAQVPVIAFIDGREIYRYWPPEDKSFCALLRTVPAFEATCAADRSEAARNRPATRGEFTCHAGYTALRRTMDLGPVGKLTVFFGARARDDASSVSSRERIIEAMHAIDPARASALTQAHQQTPDNAPPITSATVSLLNANLDAIGTFMRSAIVFRLQSISMAHEIAVMLAGVGLLLTEAEDLAPTDSIPPDVRQNYRHVMNESRLGLYIVRNFLSHTSETRYEQVVRPTFQRVNLNLLLVEMVDLYKHLAREKDLAFDTAKVGDLPLIFGSDMELRRLLHNIFSNAVKYSYHTIPQSARSIRIATRNPYDPGFRRRRFSISIANYGYGLAIDEVRDAFKPGFRGRDAIAEVPIGAGIGLSEARKIMHVHDGEIRIHSEPLHPSPTGTMTYLTTVDLLFPLPRDPSRLQGHP